MKKLVFATFCLLVLLANASAQTEAFDIASFRPPAGWKKEVKPGVVIYNFADQKAGTYAMIILHKSQESSGTASADFDADWREFIAGQLGVKGTPQMEPQRQSDGWSMVTGGATFENELGTSAVILSTYSGYGIKWSAAAVFNSQAHLAAIEAFASSIVLSKPATVAAAPAAVGNVNAAILGTWGKNVGARMTYGDPVAAGMAGYSKDQYTFNADGTYLYVSKTFRMSYDKILLVIESGKFTATDTLITIDPQKSVMQAWSKADGVDKWGRLISSQNRAPEKVTYRYTKHYFSGIDQWQLVLQADNPTERDGPYSTFTAFTNAWYFSPISPNNPKVELPR